MEKTMKILSFWSINSGAETRKICDQMLALRQHGIEGVVFHPRFYPGDPAYLSEEFLRVVSEVILYAESIGMEFWIYDENGWPSGSADGQVLARHPGSVRSGLALIHPEERLENDRILTEHDGKYVVCRSQKGLSPLCRETTDTFLQLTHERYLHGLSPEAFDYVTGFFCDEVDYFPPALLQQGAVPWCGEFEAYYRQKYGESPLPDLWRLYERGEEQAAFKVRFWETAADLIARNFYQPYREWCDAHGKRFTGHLKGEESPYFQLMFSGSCFTQLKNLSLPAIDTLERFPGNHFFPYLLASVAAQQGRDGCLAEAMGGAGWGVSPGDLTRYLNWLAEAGVDRIVLHLQQLELKAQAIRDWPPSTPLHLTWHEAFPTVLDEIRLQSRPLLKKAWEAEKTLIVTPTRGVMAAYSPEHAAQINLHNGDGIPADAAGRINQAFLTLAERCYDAGLSCHFTEERALGEAKIENGSLVLGKMRYRRVIVAEGCRFEDKEAELTEKMRAAGLLTDVPTTRKAPRKSVKQNNFTPKQSEWTIRRPETNRILPEFAVEADGALHAELPVKGNVGAVTLCFSDPVNAVTVNGSALSGTDGGRRFTIPAGISGCKIAVTPAAEKLPFAWLNGDFRVEAEDGFAPFDDRQLCCNGHFALAEWKADRLDAGELISQGLPFFGGEVRADKTFVADRSTDGMLTFDGLRAAAARVLLDDRALGWWWPEHPLPVTLSAGTHRLTVFAVPSTFNVWGPHRYYMGDGKLVSPDTYKGRGGCTDPADAPAVTLTDTLKFVRFEIAGKILLTD